MVTGRVAQADMDAAARPTAVPAGCRDGADRVACADQGADADGGHHRLIGRAQGAAMRHDDDRLAGDRAGERHGAGGQGPYHRPGPGGEVDPSMAGRPRLSGRPVCGRHLGRVDRPGARAQGEDREEDRYQHAGSLDRIRPGRVGRCGDGGRQTGAGCPVDRASLPSAYHVRTSRSIR